MERDWEAVGNPSVFKPVTLDHVGPKPVTFTSRKELNRYCHERGLIAKAFE